VVLKTQRYGFNLYNHELHLWQTPDVDDFLTNGQAKLTNFGWSNGATTKQ
jgi:hypothetical protein